MKKRLFSVLLAGFLLSIGLCVFAGAAQSPSGDFAALFSEKTAGFETELTDTSGQTLRFAGVPDAAALEQSACTAHLDGYAVFYRGELLLTVQLHDIDAAADGPQLNSQTPLNGYYSASFPIAGGQYDVFLTGLSKTNLELVQNASIQSVLSGGELLLEDLGFIDTEKQYYVDTDSDEQMCWAASTSNLLYYTGWAEQAGFYSPDLVYEELIRSFSDEGGRCYYGLNWFFNGYNEMQGYRDWASSEVGDFCGFLPRYCIDSVAEELDFSVSSARLDGVLEKLEQGYGAELNFGWYERSGGAAWRDGGHSITLWGMVTEREKFLSDPADASAYCALIVSDSDSDVTYGEDRRSAPNMLSVRSLQPAFVYGYDTWTLAEEDAVIEGVTLLCPYSDDIATDSGTCDALSSPDLRIDCCDLYAENAEIWTNALASGEKIFADIGVTNIGGATYHASLSYRVRVYSLPGESCVYDSGDLYTSENLRSGSSESLGYTLTKTLSSGCRYRMDVELDTEGEAYYGNNRKSVYFSVSSRGTSQDSLRLDSVGIVYASDSGYFEPTLTLKKSGSIGFAVRQYVVWAKADYQDYYDVIYAGSQWPSEISDLYLDGASSMSVRVYAVPEDPLAGYDRLLGTKSVSLSYLSFYPYAYSSSYRTVAAGASSLAGDDAIDLEIYKDATKSGDDFSLMILAYDEAADRGVCLVERTYSCSHSDFSWYGSLYVSFHDFDEGVSLPAGSYELICYLDFDESGGEYQYWTGCTCGTLEVVEQQPGVSYHLSAQVDSISADSALLCCRIDAPAGSSFKLTIRYGLNGVLSETIDKTYTGFTDYYKDKYFRVPTQPGAEYSYQVEITSGGSLRASTETALFTSAAADALNAEKPAASLIPQGSSACFVFTAPKAGLYTLSVSGPDTTLRLWDGAKGNWTDLTRLPEGYQSELTMQSGESAYLCLTADRGTTARLLVSAEGASLTDAQAWQRLTPGENRLPLTAGQCVYCLTPLSGVNGTIRLTASGRDGALSCWNEAENRWDSPVYFTTDGKTIQLSVAAGTQKLLRLQSFTPGGCSLRCEGTALFLALTDSGATVQYTPQESGSYIAALYDAHGKMLDKRFFNGVKDIQTELLLRGNDGASVRIFRLAPVTNMPVGAAMVFYP